MRRGIVAAAFVLAAAALAAAQGAEVLVENWSGVPVGTKGVPPGWKKQIWGSPSYDFTVASESPNRVLHLLSAGDSSTINKEVSIDVRQYPILTWRWKVVTVPAGADARRKEADDEAAQLYVTFERFPSAVRSRIIGYIWDTTAPAGTIVKSQKTGLITYVVLRSGEAELGQWVTETRNVLEDYRKIYGENPSELIKAVSIGIDSDDTSSKAEAFVGEIVFKKP